MLLQFVPVLAMATWQVLLLIVGVLLVPIAGRTYLHFAANRPSRQERRLHNAEKLAKKQEEARRAGMTLRSQDPHY